MAIKIICPNTKVPIKTGVGASYADLQCDWDKYVRIECPHCGTSTVSLSAQRSWMKQSLILPTSEIARTTDKSADNS